MNEPIQKEDFGMSTILPGPSRAPEPRKHHGLLIAAIVLLACVAVVVAAVIFVPRPTASPEPSPSPSTAQAEVGGVNGCLAGTDVTTAAMLNAQRNAPHTQAGAVSLASVVFAWMTQIPRIPQAEGDSAMNTLLSKSAAQSMRDIPRQLASATFPPDLKTGRISYVNGRYLIESSSADEVRVSVGGSIVYNGQRADGNTGAMTFDLVWESGMWKLKNNDQAPDASSTLKSGTAFTGGC